MIHVAILLAVSVGLVVAVVAFVGFENTAEAVQHAGVGSFAVVGFLTVLFLALQAWAWASLNRPIEHHVPYHTLFEAVLVGLAGNIITPSSYLGGEPLKVLYVSKSRGLPGAEVTGSVVLSKYFEAISFIIFFSFSTVVAAVAYRRQLFGDYFAIGSTMLVVAGMFIALAGTLWLALANRWRPLTALVEMLARWRVLRRVFAPLAERTRAMEDQVSRVFHEEGTASRHAFLALLLGHVAIFAKPAAFFYFGAGFGLSLAELCLIFVAGQALLALQLTPSGAGTLDSGLIGVFTLMGIDRVPECMAFLLCLRFWDALIVITGVTLGARVGARVFSNHN